MNTPSTRTLALSLISLVLAGCASTKETVLPQDGPSMKTIYEEHVVEMNARDPQVIRGELGNRPILTGDAALQGYTRDAFNEIDVLFPRLPNPTLVMYVFPHLAGDDAGTCARLCNRISPIRAGGVCLAWRDSGTVCW